MNARFPHLRLRRLFTVLLLLAGPGALLPASAMQGSGSLPLPCGQYDDGSTDTAFGMTGGGEIGWLHEFDCLQTITTVHTAYGTAVFPGSVTNGALSQIAVYIEDPPDGDPRTGLTRVVHATTVVTNGDTDILNANPLPAPAAVDCRAWVLASAEHAQQEFPAGWDSSDPFTNSWLVGDQATSPNGGHLDTLDLNNNSMPPIKLSDYYYHGSWLLRAEGFVCGGGDDPFFSLCDCTTSGPCGNHGSPGHGCGNGSAVAGALLEPSGTPTPGGLTLVASDLVPGQPGLYIQGDVALNGGSGLPFGDGLRCVGRNVVRLEVVFADDNGNSQTSVDIFTAGGVTPGDIKYYQLWYRDPAGSSCGGLFNLSNALRVHW